MDGSVYSRSGTPQPRQTSSLLQLPAELVTSIIVHLPLTSIHALSQTCHAILSHLNSETQCWHCLPSVAAYANVLAAGATRSTRNSYETYHEGVADFHLLAALGGLRYLTPPPQVWIQLLPKLSRDFAHVGMELPRLTNEEWGQVCRRRFSTRFIELAVSVGKFQRGGWKKVFIAEIASLEHADDSGCLSQHFCPYMVLHRKYGLTQNRLASRGFDPLTVFDELKTQNSLSHLTTVEVTLPSQHTPTDIRLHAFLTIGLASESSSRINNTGEELLELFGEWKSKPTLDEGEKRHAVLGPIL